MQECENARMRECENAKTAPKTTIMKHITIIINTLALLAIFNQPLPAQAEGKEQLAKAILANEAFDKVMEKGNAILQTGFNAGDGYAEVWIRDLNTFITYSCRAMPQDKVREALLKFFYFQGFDGNIPDGYQEVPAGHQADNYGTYARYDMPGFVFHKNTVETDQETSLIQAVYRYVQETGDRSILEETIRGKTVVERLEFALDYLMKHKFNEKNGLLWGGTTTDWGDVQPYHKWGVKYDEYGIPAIDIYDNAMFLIALDNFCTLTSDKESWAKWRAVYGSVKTNIRKHLWDEKNKKFIPHLYIQHEAFPGLNENEIFYHGGTAVAIQAGLLSKEEIRLSLKKMRQNVKACGAQSIGLTLYPPYPAGSFANKGMDPYSYQNAGDWTWFGARMITALMQNGMVEEAYQEIQPFVNRVVKNDGFFEWYTIQGEPHGSGVFRGSAGVLMEAIDALRTWAKEYRE